MRCLDAGDCEALEVEAREVLKGEALSVDDRVFGIDFDRCVRL